MKAIKISLAVIVVAALAFTIFLLGIWPPPPPPPKPLPENQPQPVKRITQKIDSLGRFPDSTFCEEFYKEVEYLINDGYKPNPPTYPFGRFGNTQRENDQWKENLMKQLYAVYAAKFIDQAFYVFNGSAWTFDDLIFIRSEYQTLQQSTLLAKDSPVDQKFSEIKTIFSKYDEIVGFIVSCKNFSFSLSGIDDHFPIKEVKGKISRASNYRKDSLENKYVNNCTRLHAELGDIPQILFNVHISFLDKKISRWLNDYLSPDYKSFNQYNNTLGTKIQTDIDSLKNNFYNVANFNSAKNRLENRWNDEIRRAWNYPYPKIQQY